MEPGGVTGAVTIPRGVREARVESGGRSVHLTNLDKVFWPECRLTKRDLLAYYAAVAPVLVPHLRGRAMVMKRYPDGAHGEYFFMKRAPKYRPDWLETCAIEHASKSVIDFAVVNDTASLLWVVNLGSIDLNPWYGRCDDVNRPDFLHFDLDPTPGATLAAVRETALAVREALAALKLPCYAKTTGSRGIHIYVPIRRGPVQKQVWTLAKRLAQELAAKHPKLITAEYRIAKRPEKHVLVDYNQNAWGRTLASVYSVRPRRRAPVSTPVTWEEVERAFRITQFRLPNVPERIAEVGDLWKPLLAADKKRCDLERLL